MDFSVVDGVVHEYCDKGMPVRCLDLFTQCYGF